MFLSVRKVRFECVGHIRKGGVDGRVDRTVPDEI
jgi:hypothetical protein